MAGEPEALFYSADAQVGEVCRGKKGAMLVNMSGNEVAVSMKTNLPNGKYTDAVHGTVFRVKKGTLTGTLAPLSSYALIKK